MTLSSRQRARIAAILVGGIGCACALSTRAEWTFDAGAGYQYNSNLTRARDAPDRRPDRALTFEVAVARHEVLGGYDSLAYGVELRGEAHDRYRGLDLLGIAASVSYRRKFALGLTAPYGTIAATVSRDDYRVDVRDGKRLDLRIEVGRRFSESLDVGAGVAYDRRDAATDIPIVPGISGALFDLRGYTAFVRADHALDERWMVGARVAWRRGDVESTSRRSRAVFLVSDAIADDPAFGDPLLFGYRFRGTTRSLGATLSYALSDRAAIHVAYLDERTRAAQDLRYGSRIASAAFGYRF